MPEAPGLEAALLHREVEAFLFREAGLLDGGELDAWLELFAEDATYWVPRGDGGGDPEDALAIVRDRVPQLRERVWRLGNGVAHAQEPRSRTARIVGNVCASEDGDGIDATSTFVLCEFRRDRQRVYAGRYRHRLRRTPDRLAIVLKQAELVDGGGYLGNLSILL